MPEIDLRKLGDEERNLLTPLALAPRGIWFAPKDLRLFYQVRQNWRGKAVLVKLIWRMFRARVFGDRMAAIGQSLMARMRLALQGARHPAVAERADDRVDHRRRRHRSSAPSSNATARRNASARAAASSWPRGGFDHDMAWRREHLPELEKDWSFGNPAAMGDGIRAGEKVGASTDLLDEAWWFPAMCWPDGRLQFMLNERMMPSQFVVNGARQAVHQRGRALHGLRPRHDRRPAHRRHPHPVLARHRHPVVPPLRGRRAPAHPEDPVRAGSDRLEGAQGVAGLRDRQGGATASRNWPPRSACRPTSCAQTAERFNELARTGHDDDFNRGDSAYDNYYGDPTLPNPNLHPLGAPPYYAFQIILGDLGTSGGLRTDEFARVLRDDDTVIDGLYATGNATAAVMGRSYAGAGATIGPAMTFGYVAAKHIAELNPRPTAPLPIRRSTPTGGK